MITEAGRMTTQTTSAMTGAGADLRSALVMAAADQSDPDAAHTQVQLRGGRLCRIGAHPIFPDRRGVARPSALPRAIRATPRLPGWRRAAGWSGGRCVDGTLSRPALRSRVSFAEHHPAASSLPQGNCRPVDPRGSRPAIFWEAA